MTPAGLPENALAKRLTCAPVLADAAAAQIRLADFLDRDDVRSGGLPQLAQQPRVRELLIGIADHSQYLWRLGGRHSARVTHFLSSAPEIALEDLLRAMLESSLAAASDADAMRVLRQAKQQVHLLIALADLGGVWDVREVTSALTRFADAAVTAALRHQLRQMAAAGKLRLADPDTPETGCGVVILAMGKHGAGELNFSSDIDLVVFFDPESSAVVEEGTALRVFVQVTRNIVRMLQERTEDDYVLRVDLRLRPDPGSTAVAISLPAAFSYYESFGQNWERAAMIKARPVAGDKPLGDALLRDLAPFVWRKYFDYAAIADIHAMKRQIHAVRGHAEVTVAGHDVKLGRGGIREVEFFVQTQQLIFGGRRTQLRGARTLEMLQALQADGWINQTAVDDLTAAYLYLRRIEHRLQMIADEQTQRLPSDTDALTRFASFCGYASLPEFEDVFTGHLRRVEKHYARLFEHEPGLDTDRGSLVFTGGSHDPATLETLSRMGFHDPALAAETVRGWHYGRSPAMQSARAREILTALVPALLESFAGSGDPDSALAAFDAALMRMPAATELFSILRANEQLRELFGDILGGAPRLAKVIAQRPHVLDAAIDPALLGGRGRTYGYNIRATRLLETATRTEEFLDGTRDLAQEEMFLIGVRTLSGNLDPVASGRAYSALAGSIVRATLTHLQRIFLTEHGSVAGGRCVVLGMGKLGSREMTAASDLDLVLLYDFDETAPESSGPRCIHAVQYYTRLTQRLISALTVATRRGRLYDVDLRLRPSGGKGPVATQFGSFRHYQRDEAETWEHMALTRARVVAGDQALQQEAELTIREILCKQREPAAVQRSVYDMRRLIAREKGESDPWDLKLASGGLIDIEFIAQALTLVHARDYPQIIDVDTATVLARAAQAGLLAANAAEVLRNAHHLYGTVTQMIRLAVDGVFDPAQIASGVLRRIALAAGVPDFPVLERQLADTRLEVRAVFDELLAPP